MMMTKNFQMLITIFILHTFKPIGSNMKIVREEDEVINSTKLHRKSGQEILMEGGLVNQLKAAHGTEQEDGANAKGRLLKVVTKWKWPKLLGEKARLLMGKSMKKEDKNVPSTGRTSILEKARSCIQLNKLASKKFLSFRRRSLKMESAKKSDEQKQLTSKKPILFPKKEIGPGQVRIPVSLDEAVHIIEDIHAIQHYTDYYKSPGNAKESQSDQQPPEFEIAIFLGLGPWQVRRWFLRERGERSLVVRGKMAHSAGELFKMDIWHKAERLEEEEEENGQSWTQKFVKLAEMIDEECAEVGLRKGKGENGLCVLGHLFAFGLAIEGEVEYIEEFSEEVKAKLAWLKQGALAIFGYFLGPEDGGNKEKREREVDGMAKNFEQLIRLKSEWRVDYDFNDGNFFKQQESRRSKWKSPEKVGSNPDGKEFGHKSEAEERSRENPEKSQSRPILTSGPPPRLLPPSPLSRTSHLPSF